MIIYCNGDSFTAGIDLADYLLPGYPGGHFAESIHEIVADKLFNIIKQ